MRLQAHPARRHRLPRPVLAVLAVPVIAQVYVETAGARISRVRPAGLVASLLVASLLASELVGTPASATPPRAFDSLPPSAFQPVELPLAVADGTGVAARPPTRVAADPETVPSTAASRAPRVVRFRPRPRQTGISRFAAVSVRFTERMERGTTKRAFRATAGGRAVHGQYVWAEGDTVLVLIPNHPFSYGARVRLSVSTSARSALGARLTRAASATFRVLSKPRAPAAQAPARTPVRRSVWRWPLIGPITQYFGQHLTQYGFHQGIDINGDTGDPVVAARSGRVIVAGYADSCGGLQVRIDHGGGFQSWYRHLSHVDVRVGTHVRAGSLVGRVGATGCAFGSHLHFGISRNGTFVDPLRYLPRR